MQKYKNTLTTILSKLSQAVGVWCISQVLVDSEQRVTIFILSFGFLWLASDVAIWAYRFVVQPSAQAIYKANK